MDISVSPTVPSPAPAVAAAGGPQTPDQPGASQFSEAIAAILGPVGPEAAADPAAQTAADPKAAPTDPTLLLLAGLLVPGLHVPQVDPTEKTLDPTLADGAPTEGDQAAGDLLAAATPTVAPTADTGETPHGAEKAAEGDAAATAAQTAVAAQLAAAQVAVAQTAPQTAQTVATTAAPAPDDATGVDEVAAATAKKTKDATPASTPAPAAEPVAEVPAQAAATGKGQGEPQVKAAGDAGTLAAAQATDPGNRGGAGQGASDERRETAARAEGVQAAMRGTDGTAPAPHADFTAHLKAVQQGPQPPVHALDQIAVKINRAVSEQQDQISFQLRPGDLGRIDVKLDFADGRMRAAIVVENPQTLDLLQRDARSLERALGDAGVKTDAGSLSFSLREDPRQAFAGREGPRHGGGRLAQTDEAAEAEAAAAAAVASYVRVGNGRVDVRI